MHRTFLHPWAGRLIAALLVLCLSVPAPAATGADEAVRLQEQAIARIDRTLTHLRKTGDVASAQPELDKAHAELSRSFELFSARGDRAAAALSRVKLGDIMRLRNRWREAVEHYREGHALAERAGHAGFRVKALIGEARAHHLGFNDLGAAEAAIGEAVALSAGIEDENDRFHALDVLAQVQVDRGDPTAALDSLSRAFSFLPEVEDQALVYFGHQDRGDAYLALASTCDYARALETCFRALARAESEFRSAVAVAQRLGFDFLAGLSQQGIQRVLLERQMMANRKTVHDLELGRGPTTPPELGDPPLGGSASAPAGEAPTGLQGDLSVMAAALRGRLSSLRPHDPDAFSPQKPGDVVVMDRFWLAWIGGMPAEFALALADVLTRRTVASGFPRDALDHYVEAQLLDGQEKPDAALEAYLRAVDVLERDRGKLRDEQGRSRFLEDKMEMYYTPILHLLERRRVAEAFALMERSRSRALADLLASQQPSLGEAKEGDLYARLVGLRAEIDRARAQASEVAGAERVRAARSRRDRHGGIPAPKPGEST